MSSQVARNWRDLTRLDEDDSAGVCVSPRVKVVVVVVAIEEE